MKTGIVSGMVLAAVVILFLIALQVPAFLNAWAENTAAAQLARGQADAMRIQAQAQADTQAAYTGAGVRAIDADRREAHGATAAQVAGIAVGCCGIAATISWLVWRLRLTEAQLRAVIATSCAQVGAVAAQVSEVE